MKEHKLYMHFIFNDTCLQCVSLVLILKTLLSGTNMSLLIVTFYEYIY